MGRLIVAGGSFSPGIGTRLLGVLAASGAARFCSRSDWDDITVSGDTGLTRPFDRGSVPVELRLGRRWLAGDPHHRSLGPWFRARLRIAGGARLSLSSSAGRREHDALSGRDGWRFVVNPGLSYALGKRTVVETEPVFKAVRAAREHHGYRTVGRSVALSHAFRGGLTASFILAIEARSHRDRDPLLGKRREDGKFRLAVRFRHDALRYRVFSPYTGYSFERNRSNIALHAYQNHAAAIGVTAGFCPTTSSR